MPGIAGIIKRQPCGGAEQDLSVMLQSMKHETYYVGNRYLNPDMGLYLGWWAHPCSLGERMPLVSHDRQLALIILGDTYPNYRGAISENGKGALNASAQDSFRLYQESPVKFMEGLNGWFCGVVVDLKQRKITLFNDRYGMSRVYFHEEENEFIFSSEAKSLLRVRPYLRAIQPEAFAQSLRSYCVMGNKSLFKDISLLPPASLWQFAGGTGPTKLSYFDFSDWERQPVLKREEFYGKFDETVSRVVPNYMESPSRVALSLTAGLDTRVILASAGASDGPLPCYTFGGLWGETFDIQAARKLAAICNRPHEVIRINERFLNNFLTYAQKSVYVSDGAHDAFGAHDVYFNEIARGIAPVRLTGKFGSEVVRVRRLIPSTDFPHDLLQPWFVPYLNEATSFSQISERIHPLSRVVSEEIPWHEFGRVAIEQSKLALRSPYMDNALVKLMYQAPPELRASRDLQIRYIKQKSTELGDLPTDMGRAGEKGRALAKLTHSLFWALAKSEYIYLYSMPHWLTRVDRKLERLKPERIIVGRQKFEAYRIWIKTHLAEAIRDILLNPKACCIDFFDKASVVKVVERHTAGTHNYLREINKMLTLELTYSSLLRS